MNSRNPNVSVFPHREAENTIGSDQTQVCNVIEELMGSKYILIILTDIAVMKWLKTED